MMQNCRFVALLIWITCTHVSHQLKSKPINLSLTISAVTRTLQISWENVDISSNNWIVITSVEPRDIIISNTGDTTTKIEIIDAKCENKENSSAFNENYVRRENCRLQNDEILYSLQPKTEQHWVTTSIPFNFSLSNILTNETKCYGYWASYTNAQGNIIAKTCIKAFPTWMNDMRPKIENFRFRDLMIPGTHDSASYITSQRPLKESLVTKYTVTQDEDIRGQLLHGIRYLDIRVGYYKSTPEIFWANHGISKMVPLEEIIRQTKEFVMETNEIVLFDIQEFPVGFGKGLHIHELLVDFLREKFGDVLVDPKLSWQAKLREIWYRKKNVILCYDYAPIVERYPDLLFTSVEQKWGDVQTWDDLENHLIRANQQSLLYSSGRPVADMAEITPDAWGVIIDKYGGLRTLADSTNPFVSRLYREDLGHTANIVAVDFFRGTTIVDTALFYNLRKVAR